MVAVYNPQRFGSAPRRVTEERQHNFSPETLAEWEKFCKWAARFKVWDRLDHHCMREVFCTQIHMGVEYHEAKDLIHNMVTKGHFYKKT